MPYKDPEKRKQYNREYNARTYSRDPKAQRERNKKRTAELVIWFKEYKRTKECSVCGEKHIACLEFHHPSGSGKGVNPGNFVRAKGWGKKKLIQELEKLIVLCANCHRKLHYPDN